MLALKHSFLLQTVPLTAFLGVHSEDALSQFYWRAPHVVMIKNCVWNKAFPLGPTSMLNYTEALSMWNKKGNSLWSFAVMLQTWIVFMFCLLLIKHAVTSQFEKNFKRQLRFPSIKTQTICQKYQTLTKPLVEEYKSVALSQVIELAMRWWNWSNSTNIKEDRIRKD